MANYNQITDTNFPPAKYKKTIPVYADKYNEVVTGQNTISADTISEKTSANGVVVDGVILKDGGITSTTAIKSSGDTEGIGYATGAGGAVTQITSASTGVTLNNVSGQITTVALTTAAGAEEEFVVTNSAVAATDVVVLSTTYDGGGTPVFSVKKVAAGAFNIVVTNVHASAAFDAVMVINFAVIKAVAA